MSTEVDVKETEVVGEQTGEAQSTEPAKPLENDKDSNKETSSSDTIAATVANHRTEPESSSEIELDMANAKLSDVRVDNWGNYCLQRLKLMFDKEESCDLSIKFETGEVIQAHRLIVGLCTDYFQNLISEDETNSGVVNVPKEISFACLSSVVKFIYSGKLEVKGHQFSDIYKTVKLLNISILIKLLEAHAKKPLMENSAKNASSKARQTNIQPMNNLGKAVTMPLKNKSQSASIKKSLGTVLGGSGKGFKVAMPGMKLPPGVKTKTVLARLQPQTVKSVNMPVRRTVKQRQMVTPIPKAPSPSPKLENWPAKEEPAKPTRFEWPELDLDNDPSLLESATLRLISKQSFNEYDYDAPSEEKSGMKRSAEISSKIFGDKTDDDSSFSSDAGPSKRSKLEETPVQDSDHLEDHDNEFENKTNFESSIDEDQSMSIEDCDNTNVQDKDTRSNSPEVSSDATKPPSKEASVPFVARKDRPQPTNIIKFLPTDKPKEKAPSCSSTASPQPTQQPQAQVPPQTPSITLNKDAATNHSKIISEVLKKYPDLVKDNKNIKLKIVQKNLAGEITPKPKESKSKVSYIVLKSSSSTDPSESAVLQKGLQKVNTSQSFWGGDQKELCSGSALAENTTGPWICNQCGSGDDPLQFATYYSYRRHLVEIHQEKIDARICEHCGQKYSKRNLLLYHMYTKHSIEPPKSCTFPHCTKCEYVALSEALLAKHMLTHTASKEFTCELCGVIFKSEASLKAHIESGVHKSAKSKVYECSYCNKTFVRFLNLKTHMRSVHRPVAKPQEVDLSATMLSSTKGTLKVSTAEPVRKRTFPAILSGRSSSASTTISSGPMVEITTENLEDGNVSLVAADGSTIELVANASIDSANLTVPVTLVPSSEAEAMTNVASSIAASLGLESQQVPTQEYITGIGADGNQAVYIMDSSQPAIEVDMSTLGVDVSQDGQMLLEEVDTAGEGQLIVQDIHGNQFKKVTAIDENGKPVVFFQLAEETSQLPISSSAIIQNSSSAESAPIFVSSAVSLSTDSSDVSGSSAFTEYTTPDTIANSATVAGEEEKAKEESNVQLKHDQPPSNNTNKDTLAEQSEERKQPDSENEKTSNQISECAKETSIEDESIRESDVEATEGNDGGSNVKESVEPESNDNMETENSTNSNVESFEKKDSVVEKEEVVHQAPEESDTIVETKTD